MNYLKPRLFEVGKIKIGEKGAETQSSKGTKFQPPKKLDHFIVTTAQRGDNGNFLHDIPLMEKIAKETGQHPLKLQRLPVTVLHNDIAGNLHCFRGYYTRRRCICKCPIDLANPEKQQKATFYHEDGNVRAEGDCNPDKCQYWKDDKCKLSGILSVIIRSAPTIGGVWKYRTTSHNTIRALLGSKHLIKSMTGGLLSGLDLDMVLAPMTTAKSDGGQVTIFVVRLEYPASFQELKDHALKMLKAQTSTDREIRALLEGPEIFEETPQDQQDVGEEFYPNNIEEPTENPWNKKPVVPMKPSKIDEDEIPIFEQEPEPENPKPRGRKPKQKPEPEPVETKEPEPIGAGQARKTPQYRGLF